MAAKVKAGRPFLLDRTFHVKGMSSEIKKFQTFPLATRLLLYAAQSLFGRETLWLVTGLTAVVFLLDPYRVVLCVNAVLVRMHGCCLVQGLAHIISTTSARVRTSCL